MSWEGELDPSGKNTQNQQLAWKSKAGLTLVFLWRGAEFDPRVGVSLTGRNNLLGCNLRTVQTILFPWSFCWEQKICCMNHSSDSIWQLFPWALAVPDLGLASGDSAPQPNAGVNVIYLSEMLQESSEILKLKQINALHIVSFQKCLFLSLHFSFTSECLDH